MGTIGYIINFRVLESMVLISALPYLIGIVLLIIEFGNIRTKIFST
ncbi:MAG: hypothetical protein HC906_00890 [Bacteroidales bacterium]|nr:hypothetical protein [Bacteroidales bacterium]